MIKGLDILIDYNKKQLNQNEYFEQIIISIALIHKYYKRVLLKKYFINIYFSYKKVVQS